MKFKTLSETSGYFRHASTRYFKISETSLAFVSKGPVLSSSAAVTSSVPVGLGAACSQ